MRRRRHAFLSQTGAGVCLAALLLTGCGGPGDGSPQPGPGGSPAGVHSAPAGGLTATDVAWTELMIPMNETVLPVLRRLAREAGDARLRDFAGDLADSHRAELDRLRALLDAAGVAYGNPHEGHNMPGMVTELEHADLRRATGVAFEEAATGHLREHLEQGVTISRAERDNGTAEPATELAAELHRVRTRQLQELARLRP